MPKKICRAAVIRIMKTQIEKQLQEINKLAVRLEIVVEEKLDNVFAEILQKWADATKFENPLKEDLKYLKVYRKVAIYKESIVFYLKAGENKLYYVTEIDFKEKNFRYEYAKIFATLDVATKIAIINSLPEAFDNYIKLLQNYIETIKKMEE